MTSSEDLVDWDRFEENERVVVNIIEFEGKGIEIRGSRYAHEDDLPDEVDNVRLLSIVGNEVDDKWIVKAVSGLRKLEIIAIEIPKRWHWTSGFVRIMQGLTYLCVAHAKHCMNKPSGAPSQMTIEDSRITLCSAPVKAVLRFQKDNEGEKLATEGPGGVVAPSRLREVYRAGLLSDAEECELELTEINLTARCNKEQFQQIFAITTMESFSLGERQATSFEIATIIQNLSLSSSADGKKRKHQALEVPTTPTGTMSPSLTLGKLTFKNVTIAFADFEALCASLHHNCRLRMLNLDMLTFASDSQQQGSVSTFDRILKLLGHNSMIQVLNCTTTHAQADSNQRFGNAAQNRERLFRVLEERNSTVFDLKLSECDPLGSNILERLVLNFFGGVSIMALEKPEDSSLEDLYKALVHVKRSGGREVQGDCLSPFIVSKLFALFRKHPKLVARIPPQSDKQVVQDLMNQFLHYSFEQFHTHNNKVAMELLRIFKKNPALSVPTYKIHSSRMLHRMDGQVEAWTPSFAFVQSFVSSNLFSELCALCPNLMESLQAPCGPNYWLQTTEEVVTTNVRAWTGLVRGCFGNTDDEDKMECLRTIMKITPDYLANLDLEGGHAECSLEKTQLICTKIPLLEELCLTQVYFSHSTFLHLAKVLGKQNSLKSLCLNYLPTLGDDEETDIAVDLLHAFCQVLQRGNKLEVLDVALEGAVRQEGVGCTEATARGWSQSIRLGMAKNTSISELRVLGATRHVDAEIAYSVNLNRVGRGLVPSGSRADVIQLIIETKDEELWDNNGTQEILDDGLYLHSLVFSLLLEAPDKWCNAASAP